MAGAPDCFATEEEKMRVEEESDGEAEQRAAAKEAEGRAAAPARAARRCGFWMRSVRRLRLATDIAIDAGVRSIRSSMERDGDDGRMGERGEEELEREREWEGEDKKNVVAVIPSPPPPPPCLASSMRPPRRHNVNLPPARPLELLCRCMPRGSSPVGLG